MTQWPYKAPSKERRAVARTPTALRGKVYPGGVDCVINDFSQRGARLAFKHPPAEAESIIVVIWATGFAFEAAIRRRDGVELGVQFNDRFDLRGKVPEHATEAKTQWLNRRTRLPRRELAASGAIIGYRGSPHLVRVS